MSNYFFDDYQKKIFQYRYKFYLLGTEKPSMYKRTNHQFLDYRYWAKTETFHSSIIEDIGDFPNQKQKTFSVTLNLLQPEQYLIEKIEKFKSKVINEAITAKEEESKMRRESEDSAYLNTPPAHWEFFKKQDSDPEKAKQTFAEWDRILEVYKFHKMGDKPKVILDKAEKFFSHLSEDSNNSNKFRRIRMDIEEAKRLIESTISGSFPLTEKPIDSPS